MPISCSKPWKAAVILVLVAVLMTSRGGPPVLARSCTPTRADLLGPYYKPGAPVRSHVGSGYILTGTVRAASDCAPVALARLEFWLTGPDGRYTDDRRATVLSDAQGHYRFESSFPAPYAGVQPHIHVRVSAKGYRTLATRYFPPARQPEGTFDLVLVRAR
jgi:protocatechuate 3,4-dioxygenase beta subunit